MFRNPQHCLHRGYVHIPQQGPALPAGNQLIHNTCLPIPAGLPLSSTLPRELDAQRFHRRSGKFPVDTLIRPTITKKNCAIPSYSSIWHTNWFRQQLMSPRGKVASTGPAGQPPTEKANRTSKAAAGSATHPMHLPLQCTDSYLADGTRGRPDAGLDENLDALADEKSDYASPKSNGPLAAITQLQNAYIKRGIKWDDLVRQTTKPTTYTETDEDWLAARTEPPQTEPRHAWTVEDKYQLRVQWRSSPLGTQIERETSDTISDLYKVWNTFDQRFQCVPTDIFGNGLTGSAEHRLCIDLSHHKIKDPDLQQCSPLWPTSTCKALLDMMWHPLWRSGEVRSLVLALQLAVIARTDERRTWDFVNHTDSKFLDRLREEIETGRVVDISKRQSVGELCRRAHEREPRTQTSDWYLLFSALFTAYKSGRHRKDSLTGNVFMVRTGDLHAVEAALRCSGSYDLPHPVGGPVYRETFSDDTKSSSAPVGPSRFTEILCKVALDSMRTHALQQRASQPPAPPPLQPPSPTPAQPSASTPTQTQAYIQPQVAAPQLPVPPLPHTVGSPPLQLQGEGPAHTMTPTPSPTQTQPWSPSGSYTQTPLQPPGTQLPLSNMLQLLATPVSLTLACTRSKPHPLPPPTSGQLPLSQERQSFHDAAVSGVVNETSTSLSGSDEQLRVYSSIAPEAPVRYSNYVPLEDIDE